MDGFRRAGAGRHAGRLAIPWSELVSFGMAFWPQEDVETALGADIVDVLPELLRLAELEVRIPRIEVVTLERLAARDRSSVSDVLARELRDLVSEHSEWLSGQIPGFAEALAWPEAIRSSSAAQTFNQ